ncbi:MAG: hypothetical protein WCJ81_03445 [bacterium]
MLLGVTAISLSNVPANALPALSVRITPIVLEDHCLSVVPKFDTADIVHFFKKLSSVLSDALEIEDVALIATVAAGFTGAVVTTVFFGVTAVGLGVVGAVVTVDAARFFVMIVLTVGTASAGVNQPFSINAIGSTVLAKRRSLHNHFCTIS